MFATTAFGNVVYLVSGQHLFKTRFEKSIVRERANHQVILVHKRVSKWIGTETMIPKIPKTGLFSTNVS